MRIRDVLQRKGGEVVTISPDAPVTDLVRVLGEKNIGAAVVSSDAGRRRGHRVRARRRPPARPRRRRVGRSGVDDHDVRGDQLLARRTIDEIMHLMTEHRIRHVPVVVDGQLTGIVSIGDVVKMRIGELEFEREQLSTYISS